MKHLVLGGVKSGKSRYAEQLAARYANEGRSKIDSNLDAGVQENVGVIVTAEALDDEMHARIQKHKDQRPKAWQVVEAPIALVDAIQELDQSVTVDVIVVDCLTLWLTNLLVSPELSDTLDLQRERLLACLRQVRTPVILVSNETNMGLIGMDALTRKFCDVAGKLHQDLAQVCDRVDLVVAGLPVHVKA